MRPVDWQAWHDKYEDPTSSLSRRLAVVQDLIRSAMHRAALGPIRVVSLCAGQGRDLHGALAGHRRADEVTALLVELDPANVALARAAFADRPAIEVREGDASLTDQYLGRVPADIVLACGIIGNITLLDIERTVKFLPAFCTPGATLIWTRHRDQPDAVPGICDWFAGAGFALEWLSHKDTKFGVGAHCYTGDPVPLPPAERMFTFIGYKLLEAHVTAPTASRWQRRAW
jgi:hypothetical protein